MALDCTVLSTSPALEIGGAHGLDLDRAFDGGLEQLLQPVLAQQAPEAADLGGVARQAGLVVVHAAEKLPLHVLGPTLDQLFVAEVEAVLQVQQADHQADGQTWAARRADAAAEFTLERAGQIFSDHPLGRLCLVGQLGRHRHFNRGRRKSITLSSRERKKSGVLISKSPRNQATGISFSGDLAGKIQAVK